MMKNIVAIALIALLGLVNVAAAQDEHVALFKNVSGTVKVLRNQSELIPVAGMHIMKSDVVVLGPHSTSAIVFTDGTTLTLGASTRIAINEYMFQPEEGRFGFSLYLEKGQAIYSSGKLGKIAPESVRLNTPRASIGVRGTRFIVKAD